MRPELINEIAFPDGTVQKIDDGVPIRRASFNVLSQLIDNGSLQAGEILKLVDFIIEKSFEELQSEIFVLANSVLGQVARKFPEMVVSRADATLAKMEKKYDFYVKSLTSEIIEKKLIAMLKAFYWLNTAVQHDESSSKDKFSAFTAKLNSKEQVAQLFDKIKQQQKKNM